jgi:thioester reductase-like protein
MRLIPVDSSDAGTGIRRPARYSPVGRHMTRVTPPAAAGPATTLAGPLAARHEEQLTVRGARVEAGELERSLSILPGVRSITVLTLAGSGRGVLVAAVVAGDGFDPLLARTLARRILPAELLPDRFVAVESVPLTPSGGADRRALARTLEPLVAADDAGAPEYDARAVQSRMVADARLPVWFRVRGEAPRGAPEHILLTGASGFVGAHLLAELLRTTGATITCLVNAADEAAARTRLDRRAQRYQLPAPGSSPRLRILRGDLAAERFGLGAAQFTRLAAEVDTIVHAGAEVNPVRPYQRLRPANVLGTREVLRLAVTGPLSTLHHVSTLGILPRRAGWIDEQAFPTQHAVPAQGYSQTKWAAEALLRAARREGVPVSVYRLGEVMPHSQSGVFSHCGSLAESLLEACVELGVQITTGVSSDFTPVDNAARFIAAAVRERDPGDCFHVVQSQPARLDDLIAQFGRAFALAPVGYPQFHARVADRARLTPGCGVFSRLLAVLPEPGPAADADAADADLRPLFLPAPGTGFNDRCRKLSDRLDVPWIPADAETFQRYAQAFRTDW